VLVDGWRRMARGQLGDWVVPLLALTPPQHLLDLHTVVGETPSIRDALERLEAAPADHIAEELICQGPWMSSAGSWARVWLRDLADGNRHARRELADGCTTTGLARRLGVSPSTASHHAGVLRDARLIQTTREGNTVHHRLTDLGATLLNGGHR
jgi:DNA-binding transcriptional ArsR family regulator